MTLNLSAKEKEYLIALLKKDNTTKSLLLSKRIERSLKKIKPRSAKNKGAKWEQEVCSFVANLTGIPYDQKDDECLIHAREMGLNGVDVILRGDAKKKFPFAIECKNCNKVSLPQWAEQAKSNSEDGNYLLFIKSASLADNSVLMSMDTFRKLYEL